MFLTIVKVFFILLVSYVGFSGVTFHLLNKNIEVRLCDLGEDEDLDEDLEEDLEDFLGDTEDSEGEESGEYIEGHVYDNN